MSSGTLTARVRGTGTAGANDAAQPLDRHTFDFSIKHFVWYLLKLQLPNQPALENVIGGHVTSTRLWP